MEGLPNELLLNILGMLDARFLITSCELINKNTRNLVLRLIDKETCDHELRIYPTVNLMSAMHLLRSPEFRTDLSKNALSFSLSAKYLELRNYHKVFDRIKTIISTSVISTNSDDVKRVHVIDQYRSLPNRFDKLVTVADDEINDLFDEWESEYLDSITPPPTSRARCESLESNITTRSRRGSMESRRGSIIGASIPFSEDFTSCFLPSPPPLLSTTTTTTTNTLPSNNNEQDYMDEYFNESDVEDDDITIIEPTEISYNFNQFVFVCEKLLSESSLRRKHLEMAYDTKRQQLTDYGLELSRSIFSFFEKDKDGGLNWDELSELNFAADFPLTMEAFEWVRHTFHCDDNGHLTLRGYQDMFLDNCVRVPELMFKDLQRLHSYISKQKQTFINNEIKTKVAMIF